MSLTIANVGGSLTGGENVALTYAGNQTGTKASYVTPDHTRLTPQTVDFLMTPAKTTAADPGVARGGMKIVFADRQTAEGCCTVQAGSVIIDLGVRWSLNQPETLLDDAWELFKAAVFNAATLAAIKQGILPSS